MTASELFVGVIGLGFGTILGMFLMAIISIMEDEDECNQTERNAH